MDRESLCELFDYTSSTWATYGNTLEPLPPDTFVRPLDEPGWPSIRDALFHVATSWDDWLRDRLGVSTRSARSRMISIRGAPSRRIASGRAAG